MGLIGYVIKKIVPVPRISDYDSFAFVGPHPDDIEVGCGATVAKLNELGKRICFIIATDGRYGTTDSKINWEELVKIRRTEAINAAKVLGVSDVRFLDFPDGGNYDVLALKDKIAIELAKFKPDIIFTPDNHLKSEIHPDHIKTGRATEIAMLYSALPLMMRDLNVNEVARPQGIAYYYTDRPNTFYKYNKKHFDKKIASLNEHISQFLSGGEMADNYDKLKLMFKIMGRRYGLRRLSGYADAYRVLNMMHTHCLPDASDF